MIGCANFERRNLALAGTKRTTTMASARKCTRRIGARSVLSIGQSCVIRIAGIASQTPWIVQLSLLAAAPSRIITARATSHGWRRRDLAPSGPGISARRSDDEEELPSE